MKYHSCTDIFKTRCDEIISNLDFREIVKANKFILLATSIGKKYPFLFLPNFLEDFMNGVYTSKIATRYNLRRQSDFAVVTTMLQLNGSRAKDPDASSRTNNLMNLEWAKQYKFLTTQVQIFNDELINMLNCNILKSLVGYAILDSQYIARYDIKSQVLGAYERFKKNIPTLSDGAVCVSFEKYINKNLTEKLNNVVGHLAEEYYLTSLEGDISVPAKYSNISKNVYNIITEHKDGISYNSLQTKIRNKFILFKIVPDDKMIEKILKELKTHHSIIRNRAYWKYAPDHDQLFTLENYTRKMEKIKTQLVNAGRTKFFGRTITPDQFIQELKTLELGDLDDLDDQVTRIAGLVLGDAIHLQSPREDMDGFDFIIDITNYGFRSEQEHMMEKIDFQTISNIIHCRVMINDRITADVMANLKNIIPEGEQAVIFTCESVSQEVFRQTKNERTIQIIDEEGIRSWCSITPTIPCRLHSIARVMYGEGRGKIVLVRSLNYESRLATAETIPNREETTFQIGCLQEINLHVLNPEDFELASDKYFDFLCMLADLSHDSFSDISNTEINNIHLTWLDLQKSVHPELFDGTRPLISDINKESKHHRYVEFNNVYSTVSLANHKLNSFDCTCNHRINEEYYHTLCKHLVAAVAHICIDESDWSRTSRNIEFFKRKLEWFQESNIKRMINATYEAIEPQYRNSFKKYLQKYVDEE